MKLRFDHCFPEPNFARKTIQALESRNLVNTAFFQNCEKSTQGDNILSKSYQNLSKLVKFGKTLSKPVKYFQFLKLRFNRFSQVLTKILVAKPVKTWLNLAKVGNTC